jgi:hypothetical protein
MKSLAAALFAAAFAVTLSAQPSAPPAGGEKFVPTALCRLLDTRMTPPANAAEASLRQIDVRTTMCSVLLPPFATAYAVRTTSWSLLAPEKTPAAEQPVVTTTRIVAARALQFAVPPSRYLTVDVDGYFVPVGTPISPTTASGLMKSTTASHPPLTTGSNSSTGPLTGASGEVDTDFSTGTIGLLLKTKAGYPPWITAQTLSNDAQSGFSVNNSSGQNLMDVTGDGNVTIPNTAIFYGRMWYWPPATNGVTIMPPVTNGANGVYNVVLQNPHNANGDTTTRIVFFNGGTLGEDAGSPPITKFQAYTAGTTLQANNINFDSEIWYHQNQYHYRAFSNVENKDTFWVKAATSGTSTTNTRADMYVSGNVGIGTPTANYKLDAAGNSFFLGTHNTTGDMTLNLGSGSSTNATRINFGYWAGFDAGIWNIGRWPDASFRVSDYSSGPEVNRFLIDWQGHVGIGVSTPGQKLSVGGWIESTTGGFKFPDGSTQISAFSPSSNGSLATLGIGTAAPSSGLQVNGDLRIGTNGTNTDLRIFTDTASGLTGYNQVNSITPVTVPASGPTSHTALYLKNATNGQGVNQIDLVVDGTIKASSVIGAVYQDVAEWVPASQPVAAGTVVVLNAAKSNEVMASFRAYDTAVAGVVSERPGIILGTASPAKAQIATTGRVKVKVDATKHAVAVGDLLVTSDKPGMAMVSEPIDLGGVKIHRPGTLIGKALEPLPSGEGEILVLLSLQ